MMQKFSALLTDMDGTLIHSQLPICRAIQTAFESIGKEVPSSESILSMFGLPIEQMLIRLSDTAEDDNERISLFIEEYKRQYPLQMIQASLIDGVKETLSAIKAARIPICLITSERRSNVEYIMKRLGLLPLLTSMVTRDEVSQCKPQPQPILAAAEAVSIIPSKCLYIGESPFDMMAGIAAGVYTVGVASGNWDVESLSACSPNLLVRQFSDIADFF